MLDLRIKVPLEADVRKSLLCNPVEVDALLSALDLAASDAPAAAHAPSSTESIAMPADPRRRHAQVATIFKATARLHAC